MFLYFFLHLMYISFLSLVITTFYFRAQTFVEGLCNVSAYVNSSAQCIVSLKTQQEARRSKGCGVMSKGWSRKQMEQDSGTAGQMDSRTASDSMP